MEIESNSVRMCCSLTGAQTSARTRTRSHATALLKDWDQLVLLWTAVRNSKLVVEIIKMTSFSSEDKSVLTVYLRQSDRTAFFCFRAAVCTKLQTDWGRFRDIGGYMFAFIYGGD
ncbi:Hypothetical_protein [Hexamita inflata]|uniref:Hypothetical_protein n=1 Tax=Hexamita inflata TaxID=28002 RepID=A0AA86TXN0_9EUKA|nr:Hypothetical protein HINF_LOCUS18527 [Hexamita inflata]